MQHECGWYIDWYGEFETAVGGADSTFADIEDMESGAATEAGGGLVATGPDFSMGPLEKIRVSGAAGSGGSISTGGNSTGADGGGAGAGGTSPGRNTSSALDRPDEINNEARTIAEIAPIPL